MTIVDEETSGAHPINGIVEKFDFFGSSDSDFGDLVHTVVDQIGYGNINNEGLFYVLKKKLTILDDGTLNLFVASKNLRQEVKDIILPDGSYFDCKLSLKKELRRVCQNAELDSQITNTKDLSLLRFVFSHHKFFTTRKETIYPQEYDIFVIRHPNKDLNGCRTFALRKKLGSSSPEERSDQEELIPISYVSSVDKINTKWELSGRRIISLMHAIVNIVPTDVKWFITTMQDVYPLSLRNSLDSYILYCRLLFHGIKLIPSTLSILVRFLLNKLVSLESEIHIRNPNNHTPERFEKWRQEELQIVAFKIRKGEYKDISAAKSYIQDLDGLKTQFSKRFTEEDIDRNAQIFDNITTKLFDFMSEVCENGLKYTRILTSHADHLNVTPSRSLKVPENVSSILSSSDLESSAIEDFSIPGYGKKEELLYKQFIDLETTVLSVFETQILAIEKCQFVNFIPIYLICHYDSWCEKFLQINFKKLFNPHETLIVRETSVDYIVSFVTNYEIVSNFKFYSPCIKYLMQFLHDFIAHWSIERANLGLNSPNGRNKGSSRFKRSLDSSRSQFTLRNLFGLYCHVVYSLCKLVSVIINNLLNNNIKEYSFEDVSFLLESTLNANRGIIQFILSGDLSPVENVDHETLTVFLNSVIMLTHGATSKYGDDISISKYLGPIKTTLKLLNSINNNYLVKYEPKLFLDKLWLWHSGKYILKFKAKMEGSLDLSDTSSIAKELLESTKEETKTKLHTEESPSLESGSPERAYGKMESSILPGQSLWEYVWGDIPISEEDLEQELYITKNNVYKEYLDQYLDNPKEDSDMEEHNNKPPIRSPHSSKFSSPNMSLLDTILSSDAYKRGEAVLQSYNQKHSPSKRRGSKFSRNYRLS
ncbi:hypothetical protein OJ253_356 [Cryptosporidium canis]|uniref:Uncharacterized protein n=1 Tax=Cryptosporidium canis TaxID=195482 RepID=A0A9D5HYM8_9CRYT|nr:hypothetical protein OJ253_356 [Cryptosporidium canis]